MDYIRSCAWRMLQECLPHAFVLKTVPLTCKALLRDCRALLRDCRALLRDCRALLTDCRALLTQYSEQRLLDWFEVDISARP